MFMLVPIVTAATLEHRVGDALGMPQTQPIQGLISRQLAPTADFPRLTLTSRVAVKRPDAFRRLYWLWKIMRISDQTARVRRNRRSPYLTVITKQFGVERVETARLALPIYLAADAQTSGSARPGSSNG